MVEYPCEESWSETAHDDDAQFRDEWKRFRSVYKRRCEWLSSRKQQQDTATNRLFILSRCGDSWNVFGLETRREYQRRVFELSGLHLTALHDACITGDRNAIQLLLKARACCALARDSSGRVPLHHAVIREHHRIVRQLLRLSNAPLQLHVRDHRDLTPAHYVLEKMHRIGLKQCPRERPGQVASKLRGSSFRYRQLWELADQMLYAMERKARQQIQQLDFLARGDVWDAVRAGDYDRVKFITAVCGELPESQLRLSHLGWTILHEATASHMQDYNVLVFVVTELPVDRREKDQTGSTPLHYAARQGWLEACVFLLDETLDGENIADSDVLLLATDARGRTPLHSCLRDAQLTSRVAEAISTARYIARKCPQALQVLDDDGFSPLHYAVSLGDTVLVKLLVTLGANLDPEVVWKDPTTRGYGAKAVWAPCGSYFVNKLKSVEVVAPLTAYDPDAKAEEEIRPVALSVACSRLRKVKDGQLEHPGTALPMETLWFLLHKRDKGAPYASGRTLIDRKAQLVPVQSTEIDPQRYGCRRFGSVCSLCAIAPDNCGAASESKFNSVPGIVFSPLCLAIRCCRLHANPSRVDIAECLVTNGAATSSYVVKEALCGQIIPSLLQTVLNFAGQTLDVEQIQHFVFHFQGSDNDREQAFQYLLPEIDLCLLVSVVPILFHCRLFSVIDRLLACRNAEAEKFLSSPNEWPTNNSSSKLLRRLYPWTLYHIDVTTKWLKAYPDVVGLNSLALVCISSIFDRPYSWSSSHRNAIDMTLSAALDILISRGSLPEEHAGDWIVRAVRRGFFISLRSLWHLLVSKRCFLLLTKICLEYFHPLERCNEPLFHDLAKMLLDATADVAAIPTQNTQVVHNSCIAIACVFNQHLEAIRCRIYRITEEEDAKVVCELLATRRFYGRTPVEWIVDYGRLDVAGLLLSSTLPLPSLPREMLWCGIAYRAWVSGSKFSAPIADAWVHLVIPGVMDGSSFSSSQMQLLKRIGRCKPPLVAQDHIKKAIRRLCSSNESKHCLQVVKPFHEIAQYDNTELMTVIIEVGETDKAVAIPLAEMMFERDEYDQLTAVELCNQLGHSVLAQMMLKLSATDTSGDSSTNEAHPIEPQRSTTYGLLRLLLASELTISSPALLFSRRSTRSADAAAILSGSWTAAVAWNDIRALTTFSLAHLPLCTGSDIASDAVSRLLETAILYGSVDALSWLLEDISMKRFFPLSSETSNRILYLATKHPSIVHSQMTLLLLQHPGFSLGRLSGDGSEVTLFHRIACFSDHNTASECINILLHVEDCDPNVRDGFGLTPVSYAIASGNLATACTLILHPHVRLEAEYEGQSFFYYYLQMLPSFSWRLMVQSLLRCKRHGAFLHCIVDDCSCKGFESDTVNSTTCSFCNHAFDCHTRVPYPPWFRDQYEMYNAPIDQTSTVTQVDEDEDDAATRHRVLLVAAAVDEAELERTHGRLRPRHLHLLAQLRYGFLLQRHELDVSPVDDDLLDPTPPSTPPATPTPTASLHSAPSIPVPPRSTSNSHVQGACLPPSCRRVMHIEVAKLPWEMQRDVAMVHGAPCRFCNYQLPTTVQTLVHKVAVVWLLASAESRHENKTWSVLGEQATARAWRQWRDVTIQSLSTSTTGPSLHGCCDMGQDAAATGTSPSYSASSSSSLTWRPVASDVTVKRSSESSGIEEDSYLSDREERRDTPLPASIPTPPTIGLTKLTRPSVAANRISVLQLFVFHWRYARVYQCFRMWRRRSVNGQVVHHELEAMADAWRAEQRRKRYDALMQRQRELEERIRSNGLHDA